MINEVINHQFITAVCLAIVSSFGYGLLAYLFVKIVFFTFVDLTSKVKHLISVSAIFVIFILFINDIWKGINADTLISHNFIYDVGLIKGSDYSLSVLIKKAEAYFPIVFWLYIIGLVTYALILFLDNFKLKKIIYTSSNTIPIEIENAFQCLKKKCNLDKVELKISKIVATPSVVGYIKPIIILPLGLNDLQLYQIKIIIMHELAHVVRNDFFINYLVLIIKSFLFFNPFIRMLNASIEEEMENACDDLVLSRFKIDPITYSETLLALAINKQSINSKLVLGLTGRSNKLYNRVTRIVNKLSVVKKYSYRNLILLLLFPFFTTAYLLCFVNKDNLLIKKDTKTTKIDNIIFKKNVALNSSKSVKLQKITKTIKSGQPALDKKTELASKKQQNVNSLKLPTQALNRSADITNYPEGKLLDSTNSQLSIISSIKNSISNFQPNSKILKGKESMQYLRENFPELLHNNNVDTSKLKPGNLYILIDKDKLIKI